MIETATTRTPHEQHEALALSGKVVAAYLRNNALPAGDIPIFIKQVHDVISGLANGRGEPVAPKPVVPIRKSIHPDYLICLEDGKRLTMLKRYLRSRYNLTPDQYRAKWGLPSDYPMVAPNYAEERSALAKKWGLGSRSNAPKKSRRQTPRR